MKKYLPLIVITLLAGFLRFYNLNWGNGFYFHPDENNMARAISQLCVSKSNITEALTDAAGGTVFLGHGASRPGTKKKWTPLAVAVKSPRETCSLNPHFFAYGQFPLYLAYFSSLIFKLLQNIILEPRTLNLELTVSFQDAVMLLRLISALASTLTIPLVYLITGALIQNSKLFENCKLKIVNLAAILTAFTPGLIQAAHFGTTESLLTFFFMLILYLSLKLVTSDTRDHWYYLSVFTLNLVSGLALATKLTAVYFLPAPILAILVSRYKKKLRVTCCVLRVAKYLLLTLLIFIIFSPYNLLDLSSFLSSLRYEAVVATGNLQVFYTRQFINTFPFLFQFTKIFPFSLGLPLLVLGAVGFISILISNIKYLVYKSSSPITHHPLLITNAAFIFYFLPNAALYAKWTRFMTPILPFFAIFSAYLFYILTNKKTPISRGFLGVGKGFYPFPSKTRAFLISYIKHFVHFVKSLNSRARVQAALPDGGIGTVFRAPGSLRSGRRMPLAGKSCWQIMNACLVILSIFPGVLFFRIYTRPDTRILASRWIYENIPAKSYILSETGNVINLPVEAQSYNVVNFDFYNLDENPKLQQDLLNNLVKADYIIIPSRRIYANLPADNTGRPLYPITSAYYSALFSGRLGFNLAHTEKPITCYVLRVTCYLSNEQSEETFSVFDHPTILIYKKTREYDKKHYEDILL